MKRYQREIVKYTAVICFTVIFSLIVLPGIIVGLYPQGSGEKPPVPGQTQAPGPDIQINVYRHESGKVVSVPLEEYVKGVVAGEMPSTFEMEALKAQAVAARTYAVSKVRRSATGNPAEHPDAPLCDDVHCQVYRTEEELKKLKGDQWMAEGYKKISEAVEATAGQVMYYQGALVEQPLFHSSSGGKTENSEDVFTSALPYLRSVDSPYEEDAPHQGESVSISMATFASKIKSVYPNAGTISRDTVKITEHSEGGRVETMKVGNASVTGRRVRDLFGLRSANFTISFTGSDIVFTTTGYGHGVGMSQYGANGMAKAGFGYTDILSHYYSGVEVKPVTAQ